MFDTEFLRYLAQLGVGGAIAGLMFYFYRKDVKSYTELWQAHATLNAKQTDTMMALVRDVTISITTNTEVVRSMHKRLDRLDLLKLVEDPAGGYRDVSEDTHRRTT